jgi:Pyruvate/2-oxoacid:ferredoxin oxidoreductase delta subunit
MKTHKDWTRERLEKSFVGKMKAITISTDIKMQGKQRILDLSEMERILRNAKKIAQHECSCRKEFGNCIDPMNGCLTIDEEADDALKHGSVEITVEQALEALKKTHEAGLVHMAYVFSEDDKIHNICSCCKCCCHSLSAALRFGYSDHVIYSTKIALQNQELCENCGACVDRCQFAARSFVDEKLQYESEKCGGCGLCLSSCPNDAISMVQREA